MNDDRTRSRRRPLGPVGPCKVPGCDGIEESGGRCDKCQATLTRLRGLRPADLDAFERTSKLRLDRLAIVRDERKMAGLA